MSEGRHVLGVGPGLPSASPDVCRRRGASGDQTRRVELARGTSRGRVLGGASSFSSGLRRAGRDPPVAFRGSWNGKPRRSCWRCSRCCSPAHQHRHSPGPSGLDRLRITARHDQLSLEAGADATATGTVARPGDFEDTTLPLDLYTARLLVTTLPRTRHCPRSTPRADTPHTDGLQLLRDATSAKCSTSPMRPRSRASCGCAAT